MPRAEFTKAVKAEMFRRATVDGTTFCEGCGLALKKWNYDHTIPDALILDKKRKLTASEGKLLGECCHTPKTKQDVKNIAKAKRVEAKHVGAAKPKSKLANRPKQPKPKRDRIPELNPRRSLYVSE